MKVNRIDIQWHPGMPVFAKEEFLKAVGDDYGWLGGFDESGKLKCVLPYTILRKAIFRLVRFRTQTIPCSDRFELPEEKAFLNSVVRYFKAAGADVIIPPSNNAIFRTYPDGADVARYGTYVIDLCQPEEVLWRNLSRTTGKDIRKAQKDGVCVREGIEFLEPAWRLFRETFHRSKMPFMALDAFKRFVTGLGENGRLMMAEYNSVPQSYRLYGFSTYCAYAIYAGNPLCHHRGASKMLHWEAMHSFRSRGVQRFDFYGARIKPEKGSKQEGINMVKEQLGAKLTEGFMWKFPLRRVRSRAYSIGVRLLRGGDIVDQERCKLNPSANPGEKLTPAQAQT